MRLWIGQVIIVALGLGFLAMGPVESAVAPAPSTLVAPLYVGGEALPARPALAPSPAAGVMLAAQLLPANPLTVTCIGPVLPERLRRIWITQTIWTWIPYAAVRQRCWTSCCGYDSEGNQDACNTYTWTQFDQAGCC